MKTLGGSTFVWNGVSQDYNFIETMDCLYELCDQVSVSVGGNDGTTEKVFAWAKNKKPGKVLVTYITKEDWDAQIGREKLSYFSNLAIDKLETDWNIYLQSDEIIHEDSFEVIRHAIECENVESFFCRRLNLWKTPYQVLNVPQDRKPCSTEVIRLAKTQYKCVGDAESLGVISVHIPVDIDNIMIFHMGFVRDKVKHLEKIRHIQTEVFLWGDFDVKAKDCAEFQPDRWFDPEKDLIPIPKPLPKFIQKWADERYPDLISIERDEESSKE